MSPHRILAAASVAVVLSLVGCASQPASEPTPRATGSTPSAEPSPTPTLRADPVRPFGGDCASVLTTPQLDALVGAGAVPIEQKRLEWSAKSAEYAEVPAVGTLGGVECEWYAAEEAEGLPNGLDAIAVILMPAASVPPAFLSAYDAPLCEPNYDTVNCRMTRVDGEIWAMARAGWNLSEPPTELLSATIDAALGNARDAWHAQRADRAATWWALEDCAALHESMSLEAAAGPYVEGWWEGSERPEMALLRSAGVEQFCPWYTDQDATALDAPFYIGNTTISPGAAWYWSAIISTAGMEPISVEGAQDAVVATSFAKVYATDGVNVISVSASEDAAVAADIAGRALAALAGG